LTRGVLWVGEIGGVSALVSVVLDNPRLSWVGILTVTCFASGRYISRFAVVSSGLGPATFELPLKLAALPDCMAPLPFYVRVIQE
jgi:hypothetical protein